MAESNEPTPLWTGRRLSAWRRGDWEFCRRRAVEPAVGIVAITPQRQVVVVEQYRGPVDRRTFELPAGLVGDLPGAEGESLIAAAARELLEETGYAAERWTRLARGYSSPGLTDETVELFLAEELRRAGQGGGEAGEAIRVHLAPVDGFLAWLEAREATADLKLLAGLFAAQEVLRRRAV